jgi:hypothetical protein
MPRGTVEKSVDRENWNSCAPTAGGVCLLPQGSNGLRSIPRGQRVTDRDGTGHRGACIENVAGQ